MTQKNNITFIIACLNNCTEVIDTLCSIKTVIDKNDAIIVVDGNSYDGTVNKVKSYLHNHANTTIISENDTGIYDAWNKAIKLNKNEWLCFLGAGDILPANYKNLVFRRSNQTINTNFIFGNTKLYKTSKGEKQYSRTIGRPFDKNEFKKQMRIVHTAALHHSSLFNKAQFSTEYKSVSDYYFLLSNIEILRPTYINEIVVYKESTGISANSLFPLKEELKMKINMNYSKRASYCQFIKNVSKYYFFNIFDKLNNWVKIPNIKVKNKFFNINIRNDNKTQTKPKLIAVELLNLKFETTNIDGLNELIFHAIKNNQKLTLLHHNIHSLHLTLKDKQLEKIYSKQRYVAIDGMPIIWILKALKYNISSEYRATLLDWMPKLFELANKKKTTIFLYGAKEELIIKTYTVLQKRYPDINFFYHHGYTSDELNLVKKINAVNPEIVIVGLGMPIQEKSIDRNKTRLNANAIIACGGYFDYISGATYTPPRWAGRIGLEWLIRFRHDPRRLFKRYFIEPWFVLYAFITHNRS